MPIQIRVIPTPGQEYIPITKIEYVSGFSSATATLGLKEMGKFLWEGREKGLSYWLSQFSKTKLRQTFFPCLPKGIFPFP